MTLPSAELLLQAYASGYFPMAQSGQSSGLYWFNPETRGILPIGEGCFHLPRSLRKFLRRNPFRVSINEAFPDVLRACADMRGKNRNDTWINNEIIHLYTELASYGHAHSVECWEGGTLVGGLYGVSLGGAFFGESMFSHRTNASKVALAHLVERLRAAGYCLLDAQFENPHLTQFGFIAVSQADYLARLRQALQASPNPSSRFSTVSPLARF